MTRVLVVTGAVGVGKTTVAWEIAEVLEERDVRYGFFDPDAVHFHPRPADDRFGYRVSLAALAAVWPLMDADRLVLPMIVETRAALDLVGAAIGELEVVVARLTAPASVVEERLRTREVGAGLEWHLARALELEAHWRDHPVEDVVVENVGAVRGVALEVLRHARWVEDGD